MTLPLSPRADSECLPMPAFEAKDSEGNVARVWLAERRENGGEIWKYSAGRKTDWAQSERKAKELAAGDLYELRGHKSERIRFKMLTPLRRPARMSRGEGTGGGQ